MDFLCCCIEREGSTQRFLSFSTFLDRENATIEAESLCSTWPSVDPHWEQGSAHQSATTETETIQEEDTTRGSEEKVTTTAPSSETCSKRGCLDPEEAQIIIHLHDSDTGPCHSDTYGDEVKYRRRSCFTDLEAKICPKKAVPPRHQPSCVTCPRQSLDVSLSSESEAYLTFVRDKDPLRNELFSPSTQGLLDMFSHQDLMLPLPKDDLEKRNRMLMLVSVYTEQSQLYLEMNRALRDEHKPQMRHFASFIKEFRAVFRMCGTREQPLKPFHGLAWRSIVVPDAKAELDKYRKEEGRVFSWPGFTSVSLDERQARSFGNITFQIRCDAPEERGDDVYFPADISKFSCFPDEREVVFPPFTKLRVLHVEDEVHTWREHRNPLVQCQVVDFAGSVVRALSVHMPD